MPPSFRLSPDITLIWPLSRVGSKPRALLAAGAAGRNQMAARPQSPPPRRGEDALCRDFNALPPAPDRERSREQADVKEDHGRARGSAEMTTSACASSPSSVMLRSV